MFASCPLSPERVLITSREMLVVEPVTGTGATELTVPDSGTTLGAADGAEPEAASGTTPCNPLPRPGVSKALRGR